MHCLALTMHLVILVFRCGFRKIFFYKCMLLILGHLICLLNFNFYFFEMIISFQSVEQLRFCIGRTKENYFIIILNRIPNLFVKFRLLMTFFIMDHVLAASD